MSSVLLQIIEKELKDTSYDRRDSIAFDNIKITTLFWKRSGLIVDVLLDENECSLASKTLSHIFSFDIDDVEEVAMEIVVMIKNHEK